MAPKMETNQFFRFAAWSLTTLIVLGVALNLVAFKGGSELVNHLPVLVKIPIALIGAAGTLGLFALWPSMMWHCVVINRGSLIGRAAWLISLLLTIPLATLAYYFIVFRDSNEVQRT